MIASKLVRPGKSRRRLSLLLTLPCWWCYNRSVDCNTLKAYKNYRWIVKDPSLLGGKPAIRGTRLAASLILACLAEGMSAQEIEDSYGPFPHEAIPEALKAASELLDSPHVAA